MNNVIMKKYLTIILVGLLFISMCACDRDDEPSTGSSSNTTSKSEIKPEIDRVSDVTSKSDFAVTFRVKSVDFPNVTMKYSRETAKTANPSLNRTSHPAIANVTEVKSKGYSWYYYKAIHTGFNGGNYIYYQISASNKKGSDKSSVSYCSIKR